MYNDPNREYVSEKGRPFRVSSIGKVPDTEKVEWENRQRTEKHHWEVIIIFLDDISPRVLKLTYDHNDKLYKTEPYAPQKN